MEFYHINVDSLSVDEFTREQLLETVRGLDRFDFEDLETQFLSDEE